MRNRALGDGCTHTFSPLLGAECSENEGPRGLENIGEGDGSKAPPANLPDPPKLVAVPVTSGLSAFQDCPFAPTSPAGPPFPIPVTSPWLTSGRLLSGSSLVHRTSRLLWFDRSRFPRALPFLPCPQPLAPRVSLQPDRGPPPPLPGCGLPWPGSRQGKFPGPGPMRGWGRLLSPPLRAEAGVRNPPAPRRPPPRVGTPDFQPACHFRQLGGGGGSVRGLCGQSGSLRASRRPLCAEPAWEFAQGRLCTPGSFPEDAEHSARSTLCGCP